MRIVYIDEAGRGRVDEEPYFVVACAITHPDTQWHNLRRHYADLANEVLDVDRDETFDEYVFQAKHVWHGSGDFSRERFTRQERLNILLRLAQVPALYGVTICLGAIDRKTFAERASSGKPRLLEHAYCYALALQYVDTWMAEQTPTEVAIVIAEDTDSVKETIRFFHEGAQKTDTYDEYYDQGLFKTTRIVETVSFAKKDASPLLQIADHCAFLAKRKSAGCHDARTIWETVRPQVWSKNRHEGAALLARIPLRYIKFG